VKAIQDSKDDLLDIMKRWTRAKRVQAFLAEVDSLVSAAPPEDHERLRARLGQMREFLGTLDVLQLVREWKLPEER
jgi:hypothetical protein